MAWKCLQLCRTHCLHNCFFSVVNYRGFPRQLTTAGLGNPRQLTAKRKFCLLHVFLNLLKCVNNNFLNKIVSNFERGVNFFIFFGSERGVKFSLRTNVKI